MTAAVALAAAAGIVTLGLTAVPALAGCAAGAAALVPASIASARANKRRRALLELWPDVVDNLASGVRAGLSLPEALAQVSRRGPETLRPAFAGFASAYQASGRFDQALDDLKLVLADPVADRLCEALRLAREVGGSDLGRLLRSLSEFLREDVRTRAELEARQSWTKHGARLGVAAPWLVLALMASRPESLMAFRTGTGGVVLTAGAVLSALAYRLMVRIGSLPVEPRVLG